jgi:hypothetical protein
MAAIATAFAWFVLAVLVKIDARIDGSNPDAA